MLALSSFITTSLFPEESVSIEYKSHFTPYVGNTICAFLNTIGGKVYIGIDEHRFTYGANNKDRARLDDLINSSSFYPNPSKLVEIDQTNIDGRVIIVVSVSPSDNDEIYAYKHNIYYRQNNTNRVLNKSEDVEEVIKSNRRIAKGLSVMKDYSPYDKGKNEDFASWKKGNNIQYKRIGVPPKNTTYYYKYLSLDTVLTILRKDPDKPKVVPTLRFIEPPAWDDQYESHFYNANYGKVTKNKNSIPKLYATCFTPREESEPAWQIYNREKDGIGKRCVQFRFNQIELRKELIKNLHDCLIVEGTVEYVSKYLIKTLHLSTDAKDNHSDTFDKYFSDFTIDNYIKLLLLKRTAYEHEQEVRIFIIYEKDKLKPKAKNKDDSSHEDIPLDWLAMLEGIRVDPKCSAIEMNLLQDAVNKLIDESGRDKDDIDRLKQKLVVTKYNVNEDEDRNRRVMIGETYKQYEERMKKIKASNPISE